MAMNGLAVKVLLAFALCVFAVTLVTLLVSSVLGAAVLDWLTTQGPSPCGCIFVGK
jgi:hypothetical protein